MCERLTIDNVSKFIIGVHGEQSLNKKIGYEMEVIFVLCRN